MAQAFCCVTRGVCLSMWVDSTKHAKPASKQRPGYVATHVCSWLCTGVKAFTPVHSQRHARGGLLRIRCMWRAWNNNACAH
jgi:hypothetical protein